MKAWFLRPSSDGCLHDIGRITDAGPEQLDRSDLDSPGLIRADVAAENSGHAHPGVLLAFDGLDEEGRRALFLDPARPEGGGGTGGTVSLSAPTDPASIAEHIAQVGFPKPTLEVEQGLGRVQSASGGEAIPAQDAARVEDIGRVPVMARIDRSTVRQLREGEALGVLSEGLAGTTLARALGLAPQGRSPRSTDFGSLASIV